MDPRLKHQRDILQGMELMLRGINGILGYQQPVATGFFITASPEVPKPEE